MILLICSNNNTRLILSPRHVSRSSHPILFQSTAGSLGFKGSTRSSIYAAEKLFNHFYHFLASSSRLSSSFFLFVKGFGPTRPFMLRKLALLNLLSIRSLSSSPHNGCRLKKSLRQ